ncbi:MAG: T9SS type A sorting domain-containing protein [candidate division Zixibacteria bacterium]|nr:T9SS type A sorting domain-containing protein [candidate division Zixibacteria bacterium]
MNHIYHVFSAGPNQRISIYSAISLLAVLFLALASPHVLAQGVVDLGTLPANWYSHSQAWGINNDGVIAGNALTVDIIGEDTVYTDHAVKWVNGQISIIHDTAHARDINSFGVVVGTAEDRANIRAAAKWFGGGVEIIPYLPDAKWTYGAYGINDSGWVVGDYDDTTTGPAYIVPFLWKENTVTNLPLLNSQGMGSARKINNNGIAVGFASPSWDGYHFYGCAWFNGKVYTLFPASGYYLSYAFDINDSNVIVGISVPAEGSPGVLTTWKATIVNGTDLQIAAPIAAPLDYEFVAWYDHPGTPVAINNMNTVVGVGVDTLDNTRDLFIYQDGAFGDLSSLVNVAYSLFNSNTYGIDINDSGQIVGTGVFGSQRHGFLLTAKYLSVNTPSENGLMVAGETNLISWMHLGVHTINIYYQIGESPDLHLIVDNYPAENHYFVWDVPDTLLSAKVKIRIEDVSSSTYAESKTFRIKGYVLTRLNAAGDYERFRPDIHGWQMLNDDTPMWPFAWYNQFDYAHGKDPNTKQPYPQSHDYDFYHSHSRDFIDWPLFTETFGVNQCYIRDIGGILHTRGSASDFWWRRTDTAFAGTCFGFSQSALLAFDRKEAFRAAFGLPDFGNLFAVPVSDSNRKVINRLFESQDGKACLEHKKAYASKSPNDILAELKAALISETNDHFAMGFYSIGPDPGGHSVVPYRVIKDPGNPAIYRVYTYDSNNPGDTGVFMEVDTTFHRWTYPNLGWSEDAPGTWILRQPASHFLEQPQLFSTAKAGPPLAAKANGNTGYMEVLYSDARNVWAFGNGTFSYDTANGITISGNSSICPIIPETGRTHRPIGVYMPDDGCNVHLTQLVDTNVYVSFRTDSIIWNCSQHGADSTQYAVEYGTNYEGQLFLKSWCNDQTKPMVFGVVIPRDTVEKTLDAELLAVEPGASPELRLFPDNDFVLSSYYFSTYFNLKLTQLSTKGLTTFQHDSLYLDTATLYIIHQPNWDSLETAPLTILLDRLYNGNGIDDSVILNSQPTDVDETGNLGLPKTFQLAQNYPNPFNPATTIEYSLPQRSDVVIEIFDILGRKVRQLVNETKAAGVYQVTWNGTDQSGVPVSTGIYLYRIQAGEFVESRKMLLIK